METISLLSYQIKEQIYESTSSLIYRGLRKEDNQAVILKVFKEDDSLSEIFARYHREFDITHYLADLDGVIHTYSLEKHQNTLLLCLEDFDGKSLKAWVEKGQVFSLEELLALSIHISDILEQIHEKKIVHKNINPSNILLNLNTRAIKITDFGIANQLPKQHLRLRNPDLLEGTLAYMSPEQTGRMNRVLDYRSDLYSLGVAFYELFTGRLPFDSEDALEIVHCHIAKRPKPPIEINPELPRTVSNIILKLLEKAAEERYQSAWGLKADLEQCLEQLQTKGEIEAFPLAHFDTYKQFHIPQKLYGRDVEIKTLRTAFERVTSKADIVGQKEHTEIVLVTGYSGIGKSVLVREIYQSLVEKQGFFISGKFDQLQHSIPYSALVNAFGELIRHLLTETQAQLAKWKEKLLISLGYNGQVMIDVIPEFELIIGPQPAVPKLGPTESQNRFNLVFQTVLRVFSQPEHPLVIFLDDLQWIDSASLNLLETVMNDKDNTALFFIGAYRDNEVAPTDPLITTLDKLCKEGVRINRITLEHLPYKHVNQLIADSLSQSLNEVDSLTGLVMRKTEGNPFFVNQFLHMLAEDELLYFMPPTSDQKGYWKWDIDHIKNLDMTDNVVELMTHKLKKLPEFTQHTLSLAACMGYSFDLDTLSIISETSTFETFQTLKLGLQEGVILPTREFEPGSEQTDSIASTGSQSHFNTDTPIPLLQHFRFLHDRVQQAAYSLIEDDKKKESHLQIGRLLFQKTSKENIQKRIFDITDHFNIAIAFLKKDQEEIEVAGLNLVAGNKAISAMAGKAACHYFQTGLTLISEKDWTEHYTLSFKLICGLIEASYLTTSYQKAEELCDVAMSRAKSKLDKAKVYTLMCHNYTLSNRMEETLTTGLEALRILEISLVENPPEITDISQLLNLAEMTDPEILSAMSILVSIISCALVTQSPLLMPLIHTMVNLSATYGNCSQAPFGYVWYGCTLCWSLTDIELGYRFGRLAMDIMEKFKPCEVETTVLHQFNSFIRHWCEHERLSINEFQHVVQVGKETGDIEYGTYVAVNYVTNLLLVGDPLPSVQEKQRPYLDWVASTKFSFSLTYGNIWAQATQCLMNKGDSAILLQGDFIDEDKMIPEMRKTKNNLNLYSVYAAKAMLSYFNARFHECAAYAEETEQYEAAIGGLLPVTQPPFYGALALLRIMSKEPGSVPNNKLTLEKYIGKLQLWSKKGHQNFQHKLDLVEAEKARVMGDYWKAAELYEKAITGAKENEYLHEEALANEIAAEFYLGNGMDKIAQTYLKEAYYLYQKWGASVKTKYLKARYPKWLKKEMTSPQIERGSVIPQSKLDLSSIIKAAQTISQEIILSQLLEKMMRIVIENVGAEKGFLLLPNEGNWLVEAEGYIDRSDTVVLQSIPVEESGNVSANIVHYVARTQENVVLDDATQKGYFANDTYIVKHRPKSVLCLPLINQGKLTAILYLENNLMTDTFTPARLEVLRLLSSQISVSIENSLLYNNLEQIVAERTEELKQEIIERKKAEEQIKASLNEKEILLQEIHHRVKNNMTVVSSLLKLHGNSEEDERVKIALKESQSRIYAMSAVHEILYSSENLADIDLKSYLSKISGTLIQTYSLKPGQVKFNIDGDNIKLNLEKASPLGLTMNELISNSLKYAFPDDKPGEITVTINQLDDKLELTIMDNGIGIPDNLDWKNPSTLGLKLVRALVENQLDGSLEMESNNGTKFIIKFNIES